MKSSTSIVAYIMNRSLLVNSLLLVIVLGVFTSYPAMSSPVLDIPASFSGIHGMDNLLLNPVYDISDGNDMTTDYFIEWVIYSYDASNNLVDALITSSMDIWPLPVIPDDQLFPQPGHYTLLLEMATLHQVGGLPNCGPQSSCFDPTLQALPNNDSVRTIDTMNVVLTAVPIPPALWLFGSGLLGLIGLARRKKAT